jgi:competence ComEA-like helix-hairpin-helix protein
MNRKSLFTTIRILLISGLLMGALAVQNAEAAKTQKLDLNTATQAELEGLQGVGAALAEKIIAARPFKSVEDLMNVKGLGEAKFYNIKNLVTVETLKAKSVRTTETRAKAKSKTVESELVDINTADKAALEGLPGIGTALAEKIIAARPFKSVEELKNVKGLGEAKFNGIKGLVSVGEDEENVTPKLKPGQTININSASQEQLESLLGVGPVKAEAIIAGRPFAKIEDIMKVRGIKEKTFAKIRDYLKVR